MTIVIQKPMADNQADIDDFETEYREFRYVLISVLEGKKPDPYFDDKGIITYGVGTNINTFDPFREYVAKAVKIIDPVQLQKVKDLYTNGTLDNIRAKWKAANDILKDKAGYNKRLTDAEKLLTKAQAEVGSATTDAEKELAAHHLKDAQATLNDLNNLPKQREDALVDLKERFSNAMGRNCSLSEEEMQNIFNKIADIKDKKAMTATGLTTPSKERAVLCSLLFNGPEIGQPNCLLGNSLIKALTEIEDPAEARAEAWYEIRYRSGDQYKRRYVESEIFGLYKDPADVQKADALGVYRVYTKHRLEQMTKAWDEKQKINIKYATGDLKAIAHGAPSEAKTLRDSLLSAANKIKEVYVEDIKTKYGVTVAEFDPLNIQVASKPTRPNTPSTIGEGWAVLNGEDTALRTGSADDLLIAEGDYMVQMYGKAGNDVLIGNAKPAMLYGGDGTDILVGGISNDFLNGGSGTDTLIGGKGQDKMYGGAGNDTFIIEGTDTDYDIFNGGAETEDKIQGGAGNDTIRLHHFTGENRVEIIDGGGGDNNIIAGTNGDDIFDFTGVTIRHIKEICGNGGNDTYIVNKNENNQPVTIEDKDGENRVLLDGEVLSLLIKRADGTYYSPNKVVTAGMVGNNDLRVVGKNGSVVILNEDFQEGDFGINIIDEPIALPEPDITGITKHGDLKPTEFKNEYDNIYYKYDDNNNIIVNGDQADPGRIDSLNGTGANDHLFGHGGNDHLRGYAGDDILDGGSGNDDILGGEGNDFIMGGEGKDTIKGENGNDNIDGGSGVDRIVGADGNDVLVGGTGSDVLLGDFGTTCCLPKRKRTWLNLSRKAKVEPERAFKAIC